MLSTQALRDLFLNYFKEKGHAAVPSSSLVPREDDKSLLFINAGMVPFKAQFCGYEPIAHLNATSIQRCVRAGGKHNDLENVGYTARHHTFFEMLGNFSFGGYFKREAIQFAWSFLTEVLKLPPEKLWITVYKEDNEAANIWLNEIKVDPTRFSYCGEADNFWSMGDVGPCGPCSEIFYDHGHEVAGGPPGSPEADGDRYVEIWNLVFMQYEKKTTGELVPLPKPCVDTGMGLERLAAVMQGVVSNYEIDLFKTLMQAAQKSLSQSETISSYTLKVIADHIRAIGFLIADGVTPHNEGRGYVLRRIIRRALRHGYQAGKREPFLHHLIPTLVEQMKAAYPELAVHKTHIEQTLLDEEKQFLQTLHHGLQCFEKAIGDLENNTLPGSLVFKLYDTYGFPFDLTAELARERNLFLDEAGFKAEMEQQKKRSQSKGAFSSEAGVMLDLPTTFKGYTDIEKMSCITGLLDQDHQPVGILTEGEKGSVILDETPFYAEAGGQIGDQGKLCIEVKGALSTHFDVLDTQKRNTTYIHQGTLKKGTLKIGDTVHSQIDSKRRDAIKRHHSATHLLHAALRALLGKEVVQKGSLVSPDYLRFDFQYRGQLTQEDITRIEHRVNQAIWDSLPVTTELMALEEAKKTDVISLFDEKYGDEVRVLSMGDFSKELCGGTHVRCTGEIGCFVITLSTSVASGIKRIEAVVGEAAFEWIKNLQAREATLATLLKTSPDQLITRVEKQIALTKKQTQDIHELHKYIAHSFAKSLSKRAVTVKESTLVLATIPSIVAEYARDIIDQIKTHIPKQAVIVLGCQHSEGIQISIGVSRQHTQYVSAQALVTQLAPLIEGKGGGRPDFAKVQAKGDQQKLQLALKRVRSLLSETTE